MLNRNIFNFLGILTITALCGIVPVSDVCAENARVGLNSTTARARSNNDTSSVRRTGDTVSRLSSSRTTGTAGRVSARGAITSNAMRGASNVARSATAPRDSAENVARSATSRATPGRATAVFNDVSKIGSGYSQCRDAYATCMDQFCANANDTYRRCFCSSHFTDFRSAEAALDQAKTLLMQFEDNQLSAVDKSAAEVNAMYSATVGEMAIKKDTSSAAKLLDQIGDLLSGKTKVSSSSNSTSLGVLSLNISTDLGDIWGGGSSGGGSSIFSSNGGVNMAELEGTKLYNESNRQCVAMMSGVCESDAVLQMARSSYSILITQDCNTYAKSVDAKKESIKQTVRTAEKYLREARLEEYRSHNSADVNQCIEKVKTAVLADSACGVNYKRCLDYTGAYINQTTGEPIYSQRLFELANLIKLSGVTSAGASSDVLSQNSQFDKFLDSKRIFATAALDTCRTIANTVWTEFKRTALIEIAQAQDEKIEEVRMSCVSTMGECYDTQTSSLKDFDSTTAQVSGTASAYAARQMCSDKVLACASLYGNTDGCKFDGNGKLVAGNDATGERCGLTALLNFVDSVDNTRIAEGCETSLQNYAKTLCTPTSGSLGYPWKCGLTAPTTLRNNLIEAGATYCTSNGNSYQGVNYETIANGLYDDIRREISAMMYTQCDNVGGIWFDGTELYKYTSTNSTIDWNSTFYTLVYGTTEPRISGITDYGICVKNTVRSACEAQDADTGSNGYATYNPVTGTCVMKNEWFQSKCENVLHGTWENGSCYIIEMGK